MSRSVRRERRGGDHTYGSEGGSSLKALINKFILESLCLFKGNGSCVKQIMLKKYIIILC